MQNNLVYYWQCKKLLFKLNYNVYNKYNYAAYIYYLWFLINKHNNLYKYDDNTVWCNQIY